MKLNNKAISIIGMAATIIGFGATMASNWVNDQKLEALINEKVNEALAAKEGSDENNNEEEEES